MNFIGEDLTIRENAVLGNLDALASLFRIVKDLTITGNSSLSATMAEGLADRLISNGYEGEITMSKRI